MKQQYILSVDQGTSGTKAVMFDQDGKVFSKAAVPLKSYFYEGGWVEQQPEEIWINVLSAVENCLREFRQKGGSTADIQACGISNQRETFVVWDDLGVPLYNAVVWQCKRSVRICERLKNSGLEETVRLKTGLIIDPYFSGTKLIWLHEQIAEIKRAIKGGKAYFGTIDTWLLYKLSKGKHYLTDYTNASRTLFFNLSELRWDQELLSQFGLSGINLPEPVPSSFYFGESDFDGLMDRPIPITGMIGDSHAAAFGEGCFTSGTAKATLGTGCSVLMNIGKETRRSEKGMVSTICWSTEDRVDYALEGVIVTCGATLEWLKNELGLFADSRETEAMATSVQDNNGVYLIPAFSGLGAPHWDMNRKASITGLSFDSTKQHIVRAALESIPYQIRDVISAMELDTGIALHQLMIDGGITANQFIVQFLADLLEKPVVNIGTSDVSALGAAYMAGLKSGLYSGLDHLTLLSTGRLRVEPGANAKNVQAYYAGWQAALKNNTQ